MELALILTGIFLGILARTLLPFIRKLKQGKIEGFSMKFLYQAIGGGMVAGIVMVLIFPYYEVEAIEITDFTVGFQVFATAFAFGFASNTLLNELLEWQDDK